MVRLLILRNIYLLWIQLIFLGIAENDSQDHEKLSFHTYMELVYVNIRTCKPACHLYYCILIRKFHSL